MSRPKRSAVGAKEVLAALVMLPITGAFIGIVLVGGERGGTPGFKVGLVVALVLIVGASVEDVVARNRSKRSRRPSRRT